MCDVLIHFFGVHRFEQGLADGGVLAMMRRYPDSLRDAFLYSRQTLKAETVDALFSTKQWSTPGSNRYRKEKRTVVQWRDFLLQLQGWCLLTVSKYCRALDRTIQTLTLSSRVLPHCSL
jgi:hypothetical protein